MRGERCSSSLLQQRIIWLELTLGSLDRLLRDRLWRHSFITASSSSCSLDTHREIGVNNKAYKLSCIIKLP